MSELELLFFDTFSHENNEEINLDLVQFPKPVFIGEVRVIPLGARVQADFPGGVRLGATNPSQFKIDFYVNDLSKPSASTFENLGSIDYNQNGNIHLECDHRHIPTDGLVLKGWYTTITLAVYGVLTKSVLSEQQVPLEHEQEMATADWVQQHAQEDGGRGGYTEGGGPGSQTQQFGAYPAQHGGYPAQHGFSRQQYPWSQGCENYESKESYEVVSWDSRRNEKHWDHNKDRHQDQYRYDRNHEERSPDYRADRNTPEYDSRGRESYYRRDWEAWQGGASSVTGAASSAPGNHSSGRESRKRPHTPPPPANQILKKSPTPQSHPAHEESGATSAGGFESMSPGDVESISEGDIPEADGASGLSPAQRPDPLEAEPFEPILSDEDIADDVDHQDLDYDFGEYSEDPLKSFNPYNNEIQQLKNFGDPALTTFECDVTKSHNNNIETGTALLDLINTIPPSQIGSEPWIEALDQIIIILPKTLAFVDPSRRGDVIDKLIDWCIMGLDFKLAVVQPQPGFKLRHIKAGVKLVEALAQCGEEICLKAVKTATVQHRLLDMHDEEFMAISIKLLILRSLDSTLRYRSTVETFLLDAKAEENSGYQRIIRMIEEKNHARVKYSLCSIINKLHFYETLVKLHSTIVSLSNEQTVSDETLEMIASILEQILNLFIDAPRMIAQPKRYLPVSSQFEINSANPEDYEALFTYFRFSGILDDFITLLSLPSTSCHLPILAPINGIISELLESNDGLKFLLCTKNINKLIRLLLGSSSSGENEVGRPGVNPTLGLHAAYRLQALSYLDSLYPLASADPDKPQVLDILHGLFSLTLSNVGNIGKSAVVHVLSQDDNADILINFLKHRSALRKRSPSRGYICDLIILTVKLSTNIPFFQKYVNTFFQLLKDFPELNEIQIWLKPLESPSAFSYENIAPVYEFVKNNIENCTRFPGDLIMAVRLLRHLGIPKHDADLSLFPVEQRYVELKYKCVILQLYSLDGVSHLTTILQKLCDYFEQPVLHSASLIGRQGLMLLEFVHPAIQLIRRMLTYVIKVRNTDFKDMSAVPVLLNLYNLMQSIPINAQAHTDALRVCREIIETLLAYTQPVSSETSTETDALNKSLWTSMIAEVIKFCSLAPMHFISGLMVFSELLPLPLPLQSRSSLSDEEASRFVSARKMWSAHLHSLNPAIECMIGTIGVSSYQPLLQLLRRVCVQIADLAAPSALMVIRTLLSSISNQIQTDIKNPQLARLLIVLACLMTHSPVKAGFLSLIKGKDEKYFNLLMSLIDIFKDRSDVSLQCKEYIASIIQSLCDSEITLVPPSSGSNTITNEMFLANALPPKDILVLLCNALIDHITSADKSLTTILPVIRTFVLLTEHDYSYYHLKTCLERKSDALAQVLEKIAQEWTRENDECLSTLTVLLQLCRVVYTARGGSHLAEFIVWKPENHPLFTIENLLKKSIEEGDSLDPLLDEVSALIKLLKQESQNKEDHKELNEVLLPPAESLLTQFSFRLVWINAEADDDRLSCAYWLSPPTIHDIEPDPAQVATDLIEVAKCELGEMSLSDAVARLYQSCPTPGEIPASNETKKRHVETSGTKKPFVAVMRGRGFRRGDMFRSRPPNTSRPPSLHVDDFVALETCGVQPKGPTGYNKASMRAAQDLMANRSRGRGRTFGIDRGSGRFFGSPTAFHRETSGESLWADMYGASAAIGNEDRRPGAVGAWPKDGRGVRSRTLKFFSR